VPRLIAMGTDGVTMRSFSFPQDVVSLTV